jgi:hypothetical protein
MTWNYQIVRYPDWGGYGLHEVYRDGDAVARWTKNPIAFIGDTPGEVVESLERALRDAKTRPIVAIPAKDE